MGLVAGFAISAAAVSKAQRHRAEKMSGGLYM